MSTVDITIIFTEESEILERYKCQHWNKAEVRAKYIRYSDINHSKQIFEPFDEYYSTLSNRQQLTYSNGLKVCQKINVRIANLDLYISRKENFQNPRLTCNGCINWHVKQRCSYTGLNIFLIKKLKRENSHGWNMSVFGKDLQNEIRALLTEKNEISILKIPAQEK